MSELDSQNLICDLLKSMEKMGLCARLITDSRGAIIGGGDECSQFLGCLPVESVLDWFPCEEQESLADLIQSQCDTFNPRRLTLRDGEEVGVIKISPRMENKIPLYIFRAQRAYPVSPEILQLHKLTNLGSMSAGIAHDLNNLLSGVTSFTHLLNRDLEDPRLLNYVHLIERTIRRASQLSEQMLESVREDIALPVPLDPIESVRDACNLLQRTLPKKVILRLNLPRAGQPIMIQRSALHQITMNLLLNSRDAVGREGKIEVSAEFDQEAFLLHVKDTGPGVPEGMREKIFEPFFTTKGESSGTGIGLSIVHQLIRTAKGTIELKEGGQGAHFTIRLPLN